MGCSLPPETLRSLAQLACALSVRQRAFPPVPAWLRTPICQRQKKHAQHPKELISRLTRPCAGRRALPRVQPPIYSWIWGVQPAGRSVGAGVASARSVHTALWPTGGPRYIIMNTFVFIWLAVSLLASPGAWAQHHGGRHASKSALGHAKRCKASGPGIVH